MKNILSDSNTCIFCSKKKKILSFNYAGFDIRNKNFQPFPSRIVQEKLPGDKNHDFLCADCANDIPITCCVHGLINGKFLLGTPPLCSSCQQEKSEHKIKAKTQEAWTKFFPAANNEEHLKTPYLRGALASALIISDGLENEEELDSVRQLSSATNKEESEVNAFCCGFNDRLENKIYNHDILKLCKGQHDQKTNIKTLDYLLYIASADGYLDNSEYGFLQRVAQQLSIDIPSFRDLSERLGLKTSNLKKDRAIEKAGEVGSSIAAGTSFLGGVLGTLIDTNQNQPRSRSTKAQPKTKNRMNKVINGKSKMCSTCEHWLGERKLYPNAQHLFCHQSGYTSKCTFGPNKGKEKEIRQTCASWSRWISLK